MFCKSKTSRKMEEGKNECNAISTSLAAVMDFNLFKVLLDIAAWGLKAIPKVATIFYERSFISIPPSFTGRISTRKSKMTLILFILH